MVLNLIRMLVSFRIRNPSDDHSRGAALCRIAQETLRTDCGGRSAIHVYKGRRSDLWRNEFSTSLVSTMVDKTSVDTNCTGHIFDISVLQSFRLDSIRQGALEVDWQQRVCCFTALNLAFGACYVDELTKSLDFNLVFDGRTMLKVKLHFCSSPIHSKTTANRINIVVSELLY